ncbi:rhomboid family intramembrane serine protease [Mucilaginibacter sp. PPCGB 2223]|uniref:rhomboid family intramembrane serine protease n=1 Tax=Mucilaginibacter sp. PPCGB 2223 TaxID=1886027 RepID=UPI0008259BC0|nr:rhomboid family intramembrane serine protease [Mucilaginibacter sp. PPCGB 2223]OCX52372.1 rhomboid family intramembrane serine protease [Mucilaginibacter sp. PPCGB 2223]
MSTMWQEIRFKVLHSGSRLNLLIGINIAVYIVLGLIGVFERLSTGGGTLSLALNSYLALPSYLPTLLFRFWTPFTFMFMNRGLLTFIFDMLWFFWMGQIFQEYLGNKKLVAIYIFGGLGSAALFLLGFNIFPFLADYRLHATAVGAPGCIMAVIVGTATLLPDYTIFMLFIGAVRLKWLVLVYVIIDVLLLLDEPGESFVHLGGALIGFIFIKQLQRGNDWSRPFERLFQPRPKLKVAVKNSGKFTNARPRQDEIDRILDKISQTGYDSLSKQEKETLFRASSDDKS